MYEPLWTPTGISRGMLPNPGMDPVQTLTPTGIRHIAEMTEPSSDWVGLGSNLVLNQVRTKLKQVQP